MNLSLRVKTAGFDGDYDEHVEWLRSVSKLLSSPPQGVTCENDKPDESPVIVKTVACHHVEDDGYIKVILVKE